MNKINSILKNMLGNRKKNLKVLSHDSLYEENGYVLIGILAVTGIAMLIASSMLQSSASTTKVRYVVKKDGENFYNVESSINKVTAWLQKNSKKFVPAFKEDTFDAYFSIANPGTGSNQGSSFVVPTMVKIKNSTDAVQLTNNSFFGTSAFPTISSGEDGSSFNPIQSFESTDFGNDVNVRLLMVWAQHTDGNYQPIFRIDAITGSDPERGVHGINFVKSSLVTANVATGYYAENASLTTQSPNNQCWSYKYNWDAISKTWTRGAPRSNCEISARSNISLRSAIHGNVSSTANVTLQNAGAVSGDKCEGGDCPVSYNLPMEPTWDERCSGVPVVNVSASSSEQELSAGADLATQCFHDVTISSNKGIKFVTPDTPYYIKNLIPQNNSNSKILFEPIEPDQKYIIYVDNLADGSINGNQLVATNLAPHQLEIYITGAGSLKLNGTAAMHGVITGNLNHSITLNGNFSFFGALRSNNVEVSGNAVLGYDEALSDGVPVLENMNFTLYKASQRYR